MSTDAVLSVLLLVIDDVPFANHWIQWANRDVSGFAGSSLNDTFSFPTPPVLFVQCPPGWRVTFKIHAKSPETIKQGPDRPEKAWMAGNLLPDSFRPDWGSVELVRAALALLQASFSEEIAARRFILASESCLPVQSVANVSFVRGDLN